MQWSTPTAHIQKKSNDWFASLIVITGALIFVSILTSNYIVALLILSTAVALIIAHSAPHLAQNVELRTGGIIVGNTLTPWDTLESFALQEYFGIPRLLLLSKKHWMPIISIPIAEDVNIEELREVVEEVLPEKDIHEPFLHLLAERFGL
ncbi:MAG TPA: hypothetical protein VJ579_01610 [Candidatus Paceibacterota bacterium]|nr:hypothetical protein [Candidatus Paceibacterota bacterium]